MKLEPVICPTCQVDDAQPYFRFGPPHIVRCRRCGLVYSNPRRAQSEVDEFFEAKYIPNEKKLKRELGNWRSLSLEREAGLIKSLKPGGKILDIGCAGGLFLSHFPSDDWERHGVEPSHYAAEEAGKLGIHIYRNVLNKAEIRQPEYFDVITLLDTLCLSATPVEDLKKIRQLLKRDGLLFIDLPGFSYRIWRNVGPICLLINRRWSNLIPTSPHLFIFSTSSLEKMLQKAGLAIREIHLEQAPARGSALTRFLNSLHYGLSKALFKLSGGHLNPAAKVYYVCSRNN